MSNFVGVRLWEPIMPLDRGERYEDPLDAALSQRGWGEVTGGGSQLTEHKEIEFVDIDLELENLGEAVDLVKRVLEEAGAPVGSELRFEKDGKDFIIPFGTQEGLAIYLDGITLPDEVYQSAGINELADQIVASISRRSVARSAARGWDPPRPRFTSTGLTPRPCSLKSSPSSALT